jgi:hypothetical protein
MRFPLMIEVNNPEAAPQDTKNQLAINSDNQATAPLDIKDSKQRLTIAIT